MNKLNVNKQDYEFCDLSSYAAQIKIEALPITIRILLENVLRNNKDVNVDIFATWSEKRCIDHEIAFYPARVLMQDFTGVPAIVDLAAMRDAMRVLGKDPSIINPSIDVDLVIDHSVQVDYFGDNDALEKNTDLEMQRNKSRYQFLRWGQQAFQNFRVVPPGNGICHQVNLEYLAQVISNKEDFLFPDTVVGTDSHTTMINGLGVLGWGVGGIEAEAAMLGQPIIMKVPEVVGVKLIGKLATGITAMDLTLFITNVLRKKNVVGKFVEFFGEGLENLSLADRATIANMAPEYGATCGYFPIDNETLHYLELTGRSSDHVKIVKEYAMKQGLWHDHAQAESIVYTEILIIDLKNVQNYLAGPKRPQDLVKLNDLSTSYINTFGYFGKETEVQDVDYKLSNGSVVIAAITSCTNTSNPMALIGAGLMAQKAVKLGLTTKPWVKTSFAPGSKVVADYLINSGLQKYLNELGFNIVGYGCTTCIGNSGPLNENIRMAIAENDLAVVGVLSGNRNFEGRINPYVKANYLASPMLVVMFALIGNININLVNEPIGYDKNNKAIFWHDLWPSELEIQEIIEKYVVEKSFTNSYKKIFEGDDKWLSLNNADNEEQNLYQWEDSNTYIQKPPFFEDILNNKKNVQNIINANILAVFADSITTDHISPAGKIQTNSPAGQFLLKKGIEEKDFNSYGARRGNHEVMMRGTFANIRLKNKFMNGAEGGLTIKDGSQLYIFDAAMSYQREQKNTVIFAGKEYGTGSSRDWAAKGTRLLGVKAVIAQSFERIHRSNLIGMGVLPLLLPQDLPKDFLDNISPTMTVDLLGLDNELAPNMTVELIIKDQSHQIWQKLNLQAAFYTQEEIDYIKNGSILHNFLMKS